MYEYELIHPKPLELSVTPMKAEEVMRHLEDAGFSPVVVRVDNTSGQIFLYFTEKLSSDEKKKLESVISKIFKV